MASEQPVRVMVDIETLGLETGSAILSLGAVRFDREGIYDEFEASISLESCQEAGLEIDANTLEWWLEQEDAAQHVLTGGDPLGDVLAEFNAWLGGLDEIWANSPAFDCVMLEHAMDKFGIDPAWEFYEERDVRTLRELPVAVEIEQDGVEHDALDDARHQARIVRETLHRLDGWQ